MADFNIDGKRISSLKSVDPNIDIESENHYLAVDDPSDETRKFKLKSFVTKLLNYFRLKLFPIDPAEDEGKVIGFIDFLITFNSSTIMQVAVTKSYRQNGVATQLLSEMEKSFPKNIDDLVETITLEVRESNEPAKNLYLKNGYKIVVIKEHYYKDGENAIYMLKRL